MRPDDQENPSKRRAPRTVKSMKNLSSILNTLPTNVRLLVVVLALPVLVLPTLALAAPGLLVPYGVVWALGGLVAIVQACRRPSGALEQT